MIATLRPSPTSSPSVTLLRNSVPAQTPGSSSPGTFIRNNLLHDIYGRKDSRGIYLDGGGSYGYVVENNIVYNTLSPGIRLQIFTTGNIIINNIRG